MEPKIGLNVLYTDFEGEPRAAIIVGTLEQTETEGKKERTFTLAQLSVFTVGGGLTSVGAEYDDKGANGTWKALEAAMPVKGKPETKADTPKA